MILIRGVRGTNSHHNKLKYERCIKQSRRLCKDTGTCKHINYLVNVSEQCVNCECRVHI